MPNRSPYVRHAGAPMGNKHKAHRAAISSKKCAAYRARGQRELNQARRARRILKGFRKAATA
jgi:hypothetical protein